MTPEQANKLKINDKVLYRKSEVYTLEEQGFIDEIKHFPNDYELINGELIRHYKMTDPEAYQAIEQYLKKN
ncbi:hypothetical protein [Aquimarina algiphila]|uniref:Uncharacterized protein n=1 Tax=Aquimarina algiphila TaxID=2047982 RepID=A0A554VRN9_9FLAO|nr:hypothetical protein [Aquimarina algiphila]TSE11319.1 hypothetical protein FOF46_01430 [Aquimarina algiphila]